MALSSRFIKVDGSFVRPEDNTRVSQIRSAAPNVTDQELENILGSFPEGQTPNSSNGQPLQGSTSPATGTPTGAMLPSPKVSGNPAIDAYYTLSQKLYEKAKGVDTLALQKRMRDLQLNQSSAGNLQPSDVGTMSPEQQNAVSQGRMSAYTPEINETNYELAKAQKAITNFEDVYTQAQKFGEDYADKLVAPDSVVQSYVKAIEADPSNLSVLLAKVNDKTRDKILESIDYHKLNTGKQYQEVSPGATLFDPTTGKSVFTAPQKAGSGDNGLTPGQINTTVNGIAGSFDNEPVVKNYNTIKQGVQVFNSLGTSATDDMQRVYAFAKIADPASAVKEGEYNSIEKYSQAVLARAGIQVKRVFTATGILSPEARAAMSKTVQKSLDVAKTNYDQVKSEYQRQMDDAYAGRPRQITDYTTADNIVGVPGNNDQYASARKTLKTGEILVLRDGKVGALPLSEFNSKTDKKL